MTADAQLTDGRNEKKDTGLVGRNAVEAPLKAPVSGWYSCQPWGARSLTAAAVVPLFFSA